MLVAEKRPRGPVSSLTLQTQVQLPETISLRLGGEAQCAELLCLRFRLSWAGDTPDTLPITPLQVLAWDQPLGFSQLLTLSYSSYLQASLPFVGPQSLHSPINFSSILSPSSLPLPPLQLVMQGDPGCSLHVLNSFTQLGLCLCCCSSPGMAISLSHLFCQLKDPPNCHVLHISFLDFPVWICSLPLFKSL